MPGRDARKGGCTQYQLDFEPKTSQDRERALQWFRRQARDAQRLILVCEDPTATVLDPAYADKLRKMVDQYRATIERLIKMQFGQKGQLP